MTSTIVKAALFESTILRQQRWISTPIMGAAFPIISNILILLLQLQDCRNSFALVTQLLQ